MHETEWKLSTQLNVQANGRVDAGHRLNKPTFFLKQSLAWNYDIVVWQTQWKRAMFRSHQLGYVGIDVADALATSFKLKQTKDH